jgi:Cu-Zn family superoxide dismutase
MFMTRSALRRRLMAPIVGLATLAITAGMVAASGASHAHAAILDASGTPIGWAMITEDATGRLHMNVHVSGLTPGLHGIHLHSIAQCVGPAFTSAGGHHNPLAAEHGLDNPLGAHAGDLPNLIVNGEGRGHLNATTEGATLSLGPISVFDTDGSAIVIHANEDDQVTNPTGNSGARVACGVVVAD